MLAMRGKGLITIVAFAVLAAPARADVEVRVGGGAFTPASVTIVEGETVNWVWTGPDTNHSVTSEATNEKNGSFDSDFGVDSPDHPVGHRFSKEFVFADEIDYFCKTHPGMRGRIVVRERTNDSTPPPPDTVAPRFAALRLSVRTRRVRFSLDEPASVIVRLRGPTRRTYTREARAGRSSIRLPRRLRPGRYRLTLRAEDAAGNESRTVVRRFRVRRPRS
jgi:plastocyanin